MPKQFLFPGKEKESYKLFLYILIFIYTFLCILYYIFIKTILFILDVYIRKEQFSDAFKNLTRYNFKNNFVGLSK